MRARRLQLLAALAVVLAFAACTLNPQPLPPLDPENAASPDSDAGSFEGNRDSGTRGPGDEDPATDGSAPPLQDGGAGDAAGDDAGGDAGDDAGDGGDVSEPD